MPYRPRIGSVSDMLIDVLEAVYPGSLSTDELRRYFWITPEVSKSALEMPLASGLVERVQQRRWGAGPKAHTKYRFVRRPEPVPVKRPKETKPEPDEIDDYPVVRRIVSANEAPPLAPGRVAWWGGIAA